MKGPPFIAGGSTVAHNITHGQRALGHHVAGFTSCCAGEQPGPAQLGDIPLYRSASLGTFADFHGLNLAAVFDEAMRSALHHEADLIHANDLGCWDAATGRDHRSASRSRSASYISTVERGELALYDLARRLAGSSRSR